MAWEIVPTEQQFRDEIRKGEALAEAIWLLLPVFVPTEAVKRAGSGDLELGTSIVYDALMGFRTSLRDYLCHDADLWLKEMETNPFPMLEEMRKHTQPTVEQLMSASQQVQMLERAIEGFDNLPHGLGEVANSLMRPQMELQLEQARSYLSRMQKAMEETEDPVQSSMSNPVPSGEAEMPGEAKP